MIEFTFLQPCRKATRGEITSTSCGFGFCAKSSLKKKLFEPFHILYLFCKYQAYLTEKERSYIITPLTFVLMLLIDSNKYISCSSKTNLALMILYKRNAYIGTPKIAWVCGQICFKLCCMDTYPARNLSMKVFLCLQVSSCESD